MFALQADIDPEHRRHPAVVAQQHIAAGVAGDDVVTRAAQDQVLAVAAVEEVARAAVVRVVGVGQVQGGEVGVDMEVEHTVVAQDQVIARAAVDQVAAVAAQDAVIAGVAVDDVGRAVVRLGGAHHRDGLVVLGRDALGAGHEVELAVVAEDEVVALAAEDLVAAGEQVVTVGMDAGVGVHHDDVGFGAVDPRRTVEEVDAGIAVDVVDAAQAVDDVLTRAAQQMVALGTAVDGVLADAAVDRDTLAGGRGVDQVVARMVETDAVGRGHTGLAAVAQAVLRGIAQQHQGRAAVGGNQGVAGRGGGVAAAVDDGDAAVGRGGGQGVGHGEVVVALAQQDLGHLDVAVGDAAGKGLAAGEGLFTEGDRARQAQARDIGAGHAVLVVPGTGGHEAGVVGDAGVVVQDQGVDQGVLVHRDHGAGQGHIGLVRQHDGRLDRAVGRGIDRAFDEKRAGDGTTQHVRLDREGLERLCRQGRLGFDGADRDGLRDPPVVGREGQLDGVGERQVVRQHGDDHVLRGGLGQAHGVAVGGGLVGRGVQVVGHHTGAAAALVQQHTGAVVVHDLHLEAGRTVTRGRVADGRQQAVLDGRVVHGRHRHQHRQVPVAGVEGEGLVGRVVAWVGAGHGDLAVGGHRHDDRARDHRCAQLHGIAVADAGGGVAFEHPLDRAAAGDDDLGLVVVQHRHAHVLDGHVVEGGIRALRAVADGVDALAFLPAVVHGLDIDGAGRGVVDRQREVTAEVHAVGGDQHRVAGRAAVFLFLRAAAGRDIEVDRAAHRRGGQLQGVAVDGGALLVDLGAARALGHEHLAGGRAGHGGADARGQQAVVGRVGGGHGVVNHTAAAFEVQADDGFGHVAGHVEGVGALAADDGGDHAGTGAADEEVVVAFEAVDVDGLHIVVTHVQAGAVDGLVGDDEVVAVLGADHDHLVEAGAAVQVHRGVDVVHHGVGALAADGLVQGLGGKLVVVTHQGEGTHDEDVVAVIALQPGLGLVAVDGELVVAGAAVGREREAGAAAQETGRGRYGAEVVARGHRAGRRHGNPRGAVHLADLHLVVAGAGVQRGQRGVVVHGEVVVTAEAAHDQAGIDVLVVVDALDLCMGLVAHLVQRAAHQGHEGRRVGCDGLGRTFGDGGHPAQQEDVGLFAALDLQGVQAVVLGTRVEHVDDVVLRIGAAVGVDHVAVGAAAAVQVHGVAHQGADAVVDAVALGRHAGQAVEDEEVVAAGQAVGVAQHAHMAQQALDAQLDGVTLAFTRDLDLVGCQRTFEQDIGARGVGIARVAAVAMDHQVAARADDAAHGGVHVVAGLQQDVAFTAGRGQGLDQGRAVQHQVVSGRAAVAHAEDDVARRGLDLAHVKRAAGLGDVDVALRLGVQVALHRVGGVDLQRIALGADALQVGDQDDVGARDVVGQRAVGVQDGALERAQGHVVGLAGDLVDAHGAVVALRAFGLDQEDPALGQHGDGAGHAVVGAVDVQRVEVGTGAATLGQQDHVAGLDVGGRVVGMVDDGLPARQMHGTVACGDQADAQVGRAVQEDAAACHAGNLACDLHVEEVRRIGADVQARTQVQAGGLDIDLGGPIVAEGIQDGAAGDQARMVGGQHGLDRQVAQFGLDVDRVTAGRGVVHVEPRGAHLLDIDLARREGIEPAAAAHLDAQRLTRHLAADAPAAGQRQIAHAHDDGIRRADRAGITDQVARAQVDVARGVDAVQDQGLGGVQRHIAVAVARHAGFAAFHVDVVAQLEGHALDRVLVAHELAMDQVIAAGVRGGTRLHLLPAVGIAEVFGGQVELAAGTLVLVEAITSVVELDQHVTVMRDVAQDGRGLAGPGGRVADLLPAAVVAEILLVQVVVVLSAIGDRTRRADITVEGVLHTVDVGNTRGGEQALVLGVQAVEAAAQIDDAWRLAAADGTAVGVQVDAGALDVQVLRRRLRGCRAQELGVRVEIAVQARRDRVVQGLGRDAELQGQRIELQLVQAQADGLGLDQLDIRIDDGSVHRRQPCRARGQHRDAADLAGLEQLEVARRLHDVHIAARDRRQAAGAQDVAVHAQGRAALARDAALGGRQVDAVALDQRVAVHAADAVARRDGHVAARADDLVHHQAGGGAAEHHGDVDVAAGRHADRHAAAAVDQQHDVARRADVGRIVVDHVLRTALHRALARTQGHLAAGRHPDVALDQQVLLAGDADGGAVVAHEADADVVVGLEAVGVVVLEADDLVLDVRDGLGLQPAAAAHLVGRIHNALVIGEGAVVGGQGLCRRAHVLPAVGVGIVLLGQDHVTIEPRTIGMAGDATHAGARQQVDRGDAVFDDDTGILHLHEARAVGGARAAGRRIPCTADGQRLGFEQGQTGPVFGRTHRMGHVVRHQPVLEIRQVAEQVEGIGLEGVLDRHRAFMPVDPDILQAGARVEHRARAGMVDVAADLRVDDAREALGVRDPGVRGLLQHAIKLPLDDLAAAVGVLELGRLHPVDARGVDQGDLAHAVLAGVDAVGDELVVAVVDDVHAGVAMGRLDLAVARAQDLARQDHAPALGHDVLHHDGLLGVVEIGLDRDALVAEVHPRHGIALAVDQLPVVRPDRIGIGVEAGIDFQFDSLRAALDQAVDVEETRRHGDGALGQDGRVGRVDLVQQGLHAPRTADIDVGGIGVGIEVVRIGAGPIEHEGLVDEIRTRVAPGMEPAVAVEREVLGGVDVDGLAADLARDGDAAVVVEDVDGAALVDDVTDDVEVLVVARDGRADVVVGAGVRRGHRGRVLRDADHGRGGGAGRGPLGHVVQVDPAGREHHQLVVRVDGHAAGILDHRVAHRHQEGRAVEDLDLCPGARLDVTEIGCVVRVDEDRARCRIDVRHLDEDQVQRTLDDDLAVDHLGQAQFLQGLVDQLQLHLVARHGLGIGAVVGEPVDHFRALLQQHVDQVLVDQGRRLHLARLDHEELVLHGIAQGQGQLTQVQAGVDVVSVYRQAACQLFRLGQRRVEAAGGQLLHAVHETRQHPHHGLVVDAGLDAGIGADLHQVADIDIRVLADRDAIGHQRERGDLAFLEVAAQAGDRAQGGILHGQHLARAVEADAVGLVDHHLRDRNTYRGQQGIGLHLPIGVAVEQVQRAVRIAAGVDVDVLPPEGGVVELHRVAHIQGAVGLCRRHATQRRGDEQVGIREHRGAGTRGDVDIAGLAEQAAVDHHAGIAFHRGLRHTGRDREASVGLHLHRVVHRHVGESLQAQQARIGMAAVGVQHGAGGDVDAGLEAVGLRAHPGLALEEVQTAQRDRGRAQARVVVVLGEAVVRRQRDAHRTDVGPGLHIDERIARDHGQGLGTGTAGQPDRQRIGLHIRGLHIGGLQVHRIGVDLGRGADQHLRGLGADALDIRAQHGDQAATRRLPLCIQRVLAQGADGHHMRLRDLGAGLQARADLGTHTRIAQRGADVHAADGDPAHRGAEAPGQAGIGRLGAHGHVVGGTRGGAATQARRHRALHVHDRDIEARGDQAAGQGVGVGPGGVGLQAFDRQRTGIDIAVGTRQHRACRFGIGIADADADQTASQAARHGVGQVDGLSLDQRIAAGIDLARAAQFGCHPGRRTRQRDAAGAAKQQARRGRVRFGQRIHIGAALDVDGAAPRTAQAPVGRGAELRRGVGHRDGGTGTDTQRQADAQRIGLGRGRAQGLDRDGAAGADVGRAAHTGLD